MQWRAGGPCGRPGPAPMPETGLLAALRALAPSGAGCGWADPRQDHPAMPGEDLPGAVPARLREFRAGRAAARAAMAEAGVPAMTIAHGPDRAPVWPVGVTGSISHSGTDCLAVVLAGGDPIRGVGIDIEPANPLARDLWPSVLDPVEQQALSGLPDCRQGEAAMARFVAKEAAYKAQYPLTGCLLEFHDLRLSFSTAGFVAQLRRAAGPLDAGAVMTGKVTRAGGHFLAVAVI